MQFTLATLEDGLGQINPTDDQIKNYIETLPKERTLNILNKLPSHIRKEFCGVSATNTNSAYKEAMPTIGVAGAIGGGVGYYIGGVGGLVVGALIGGIGGYYAKQQGIV